MARELTLDFAIKGGVVWPCEDDSETLELLDRCKQLVGQRQLSEACDVLLPTMSLSWSWNNIDNRPTEFLIDLSDFVVPCTKQNSILRLGSWRDQLILTAATTFSLPAKDEVQLDQFEQWLWENSADWCGYLSGGWLYSEDNGAQLVLHRTDNQQSPNQFREG